MGDGGADRVGRTLLGKLRVVRRIGEGGMGTVYEVEHLLTRHRRALKLLRPEAAMDAGVVARFVREAGVAGTVRNAHVVETFDAGTLEDGAPYVLMELLEGMPLSERIQRDKTLSGADAARIAREICDGMGAAHAAGIVHRDLKPDNVFLARDSSGREQVKLLDFGISKFAGDAAPVTTDTGTVMGTPFYMSPEQAKGTRDVDARTDVYAVGVILYEMLSGVRPYEEGSYAALVVRIYTGDHVPLQQRAPALDPELAAVVERAMHVDRERRFASARDLAEALRPWVAGVAGGVPQTRESRDDLGNARTMAATEGQRPVATEGAPPARAGTPVWAIALAAIVLAGGGIAVWTIAAGGNGQARREPLDPRETDPVRVDRDPASLPRGVGDPPDLVEAVIPDAGLSVPTKVIQVRPIGPGKRGKQSGLYQGPLDRDPP